jgi:hypothetical protein
METFDHIKILFGDSFELPFACALVEALGLHTCGALLGLCCGRHRGPLPMRDLQQVLYQFRIILADLVLTL